jgi:tetrahydromethanopterin S-methyltransferase subunit G
MNDEKKEYSVTKEMGIVFLVGLVLGLIVLVISVGLVEILKR